MYLNVQISQGSVKATDLRRHGRLYNCFFRNPTVEELLQSVHSFQRLRGCFYDSQCTVHKAVGYTGSPGDFMFCLNLSFKL